MSGHGFHVHGPHDHELEHATQHAAEEGGHGSKLTTQIALFTAIIATVGAIFSYMGGATQANAGLFKNNATIKKTEANDQWNYYQSKSTKQALAELARDLSTTAANKDKYQQKAERYEKDKEEIKKEADKLEAEVKEWDERSEQELHQHHRWAQATTVLQVAIALAAIVLLTRKKWLEYLMYVGGVVGVALGVLAALHI